MDRKFTHSTIVNKAYDYEARFCMILLVYNMHVKRLRLKCLKILVCGLSV